MFAIPDKARLKNSGSGLRIWLLVLLLLAWGNLFGRTSGAEPAPGILNFRSFRPQDYGARPQNWAVAQDPRGVIYVGNNEGVLEFDGEWWRVIPTEKRTVVRSLAVDPQGRMYVGAQGEIGFLAPDKSGRMGFVSLIDRIPPGDRLFGDVWKVYVADRGVYFSSYTHLFLLAGDRIQIWKPSTSFHRSFVVGGTLFIQEMGRGLMVMEGETLRLVPGGERFAEEKIEVMLPWEVAGNSSKILVATRNQGIYRYDGAGFKRFPTEADAYLVEHTLYHGTILPDGTLVLATTRGGAVFLDRAGKIVRILGKREGLPSESVYFLLQDLHSGLWMALGNGLSRVETPSPLSRFEERSGLQGSVYSLCRHQGLLYVGTNIGIFRQEPRSWGIPPRGLSPVPAEFQPIPGIKGQSWGFLSLKDTLLAANRVGVFAIQGKQAKLIRGSDRQSLCLHPSTRDPGRIYVGLVDGLASFRRLGPSGAWVDEGKIPGIFEQIRTLVEAEDGSLWLGTGAQGVLHVTWIQASTSGSARPKAVVDRFDTSHGLPGIRQNAVFPFRGKPIIATRMGLYRFDAGLGRFAPDPRFTKLFPEGSWWVDEIREDSQGRIWAHAINDVLGNRATGLVVAQADGDFRWESMPLLRMADPPIFPENDGLVWFGGPDTLFRYDARVAGDSTRPYGALIRSVSARGGRSLFGGASTLGQGVPVIPTPALNFRENGLRFEFAAPCFEQESATRFQVLLEGYESAWSTWMPAPFKEYTNLPPGHYRFRVRARNVYEHLSQEGVYAFRILRPWWMTWWARLLAGLAVGLPVTGLAWWVVFRIRMRRLSTINAVLRERNRIAREIHDGLGHGLSGIAFLLRMAEANGPVAPSVKRALALAEGTLVDARDTAYALRPKALHGGLQEALARLCEKVSEVPITPVFHGIVRPLPEDFELHLFRISEEALTNTLRHAEATRIELRLCWTRRAIRLEILDDGKGFTVPDDPASNQGLGLRSMQDRVASLGGRLCLISKPGEGTSVCVEVPVPLLWRLRVLLERFRGFTRKPHRRDPGQTGPNC